MHRKSIGVLLVMVLASLSVAGCLFSIPGMNNSELSIQGTVVNEENVGIANVAVYLDGDYATMTKANGSWTYEAAKKGAKVTFRKGDWSFTTNIDSVGKAGQVFLTIGIEDTAGEPSTAYMVSGKVVDDAGEGIPSVTVTFTFADDSFVTAVTNSSGDFSKSDLEGAVTIKAEKTGYNIPGFFKVNGEERNITFIGNTGTLGAYEVSGIVESTGGLAIEGVVLTFEDGNGTVQTARSGSDGSYSKSGLFGKLTITAVLDGWEFTPASRAISSEDPELNFYGTPSLERTYAASGAILISGGTDDGNPVAAVQIKLELLDFDEATRVDLHTITTPEGVWQMDGLVGRVRITPIKDGFTFTPSSQIIDKGLQFIGFVATP